MGNSEGYSKEKPIININLSKYEIYLLACLYIGVKFLPYETISKLGLSETILDVDRFIPMVCLYLGVKLLGFISRFLLNILWELYVSLRLNREDIDLLIAITENAKLLERVSEETLDKFQRLRLIKHLSYNNQFFKSTNGIYETNYRLINKMLPTPKRKI